MIGILFSMKPLLSIASSHLLALGPIFWRYLLLLVGGSIGRFGVDGMLPLLGVGGVQLGLQ